LTLDQDWLQRYGWPQTLATGHPLAIAHRGASDYAPENTLSAFMVAADLASEMWELDVRLTSDGICVVSHDDNLTRIAGRGLRVSQATWGEVSALRLPDDEHIPRLEEVIALAVKTGCGLYIEIKSEGAAIVAWKILQEAGFRFACLASFNTDWIADLRAAGCEYPLSVLVPISVDPVDHVGDIAVEIVHLCWRDASDTPQKLLSDELIGQMHERNYHIVIWHEDRASVLDALWDKPVMGICSNRPELLKPYRQDPAHSIDIVCHRGANFVAPENTLEGARICIDQRFQYVEIDVRTSADGKLVVIHDATLERTTDGCGKISEHSLAEIKHLDAGGWFREGTAEYRVPTLDQMLELTRGRTGLYVEIKQAPPDAILAAVIAHDMLPHCFFWSKDTDALRWLRAKSSDVILMAPRWMYDSVAEAAAAYDAQIVEFDVEVDDLDEVAHCRYSGVRSMIYSQNHSWEALDSYLKYKPDMVNLDRPDRFKLIASYPRVCDHLHAMRQGV
jgi:glycerophosphoryl diester phosphodiesterase